MAALFGDENVHRELVDALRALGHDVLTAYEAGRPRRRCLDFLLLIGAFAAPGPQKLPIVEDGPRKHGTRR